MDSGFGFGSCLKYSCSSASAAVGLLSGSIDNRAASKEAAAFVMIGNLAFIVGGGAVLGSVTLRALGRRRKPGQFSSVGMPHSSNILAIWSTSFLPCRRGSLVINSPNIHPMLHVSTLLLYVLVPRSSSGERYHNVTTSCVSCSGGGLPTYLAIPKSAIFSCPRLLSSRLEVLRSRWRIQLECR